MLLLLMGLVFADSHTTSVKNTLIQLRQYPDTSSREDISESLEQFMRESLQDYYQRRKLPASLNPESTGMERVVKRAIQQEVMGILSESVGGRTQSFISVITGQWAESFYAQILGLKINQDTPDPAISGREVITVKDSKYFTGDPQKVEIMDRGLEGNQNLVLDAGEFITLTLPIVNKSDSYLFSTSAFVYSSSDYVSTFNIDEIELKELDPGDAATIKVKFYLSKNIPNNAIIPINIRLFDSRYMATTPDILTYNIKVKNLSATQLRNVVLDTDMPGSSVEADHERMQPGQKFEIRNDLFVRDSNAHKALVKYSTTALLPFEYRSGVLEKQSVNGGTLFLARDDLDFAMPSDALYASLVNNSERYFWNDAEKPIVYLAVDSLIHLSDGTSSNSVVKAKETPRDTSEPQPLTATEVISLVKMHTKLEPLRVAAPAGSLDAAHGFQVQFDTEAFTQSYNKQVEGEPDTSTSNSLREGSLSKNAKAITFGTYYQYRHYIEIPIEPTKKIRRRAPEAVVLSEPSPSEEAIRIALGFSTMPGIFQTTLYKEGIVGWAGQISVGAGQTLGFGANIGLPLSHDSDVKLTLNVRPTLGVHSYQTYSMQGYQTYGKIDLGPDIMLNEYLGFWFNIMVSSYDDPGLALGLQWRWPQ